MTAYFAYIKDLFRHRKGEIKALNGLRAISIIGIFIMHVSGFIIFTKLEVHPIILRVLDNFTSFVDLFFMLSGFLIYGILHREYFSNDKIQFSQFYWKRSLRIFPAYYFFLLIMFIMFRTQITGLQNLPELDEIQQAFLAGMIEKFKSIKWDFIYICNYLGSAFPHTWTLAVEEQFYLILPFLLHFFIFKLKTRNRWLCLLVLYLIPTISRCILISWDLADGSFYQGYIYHAFHTRADSLIVGIMIYEIQLVLRSRQIQLKTKQIALILILALVLFCLNLANNWMNGIPFLLNGFKYNLSNISLGLFLFAALHGGPNLYRKFLEWPVFVPIARLSYGIYIWHIVIAGMGMAAFKGNSAPESLGWNFFITGGLLGFGLSMCAALLSYAFIEAPFILIKNRFSASIQK